VTEGQFGSIGNIRWRIPQNQCIDAKISHVSFTQADLLPILSQIVLPWQRGRLVKNAIGSIQWPIPENRPIHAKILHISLTQAEL